MGVLAKIEWQSLVLTAIIWIFVIGSTYNRINTMDTIIEKQSVRIEKLEERNNQNDIMLARIDVKLTAIEVQLVDTKALIIRHMNIQEKLSSN